MCVCTEPVCAIGQGVSGLCCAVEGQRWLFSGYSLTGVSHCFSLTTRGCQHAAEFLPGDLPCSVSLSLFHMIYPALSLSLFHMIYPTLSLSLSLFHMIYPTLSLSASVSLSLSLFRMIYPALSLSLSVSLSLSLIKPL